MNCNLALFVAAIGVLQLALAGAGSAHDWTGSPGVAAQETLTVPLPIPPTAPRQAFTRLPLHFEPNVGQAEPDTKFLARGPGFQLQLAPSEAVMLLMPSASDFRSEISDRSNATREARVVRTRLLGSNPLASITGEELLPGKMTYFIGNDPSRWRTNISTFAKVRYREVYPGIDLVY